MKNVLTSRIEDDCVRLLLWDTFVDYNLDNPNSDSNFSNLYNTIRFYPSRRLEFAAYAQTPTIDNGEGYKQYGVSMRLIPSSWLETYISYNSITKHPIQEDAEQLHLRTNLRFNEKYMLSAQWYYDIDEGRMPIQQYSLFRHAGAWYIGTTLYLRDNGGKKETGFGITFTLGETGTALPINLF